jgi:hypothetical protein
MFKTLDVYDSGDCISTEGGRQLLFDCEQSLLDSGEYLMEFSISA